MKITRRQLRRLILKERGPGTGGNIQHKVEQLGEYQEIRFLVETVSENGYRVSAVQGDESAKELHVHFRTEDGRVLKYTGKPMGMTMVFYIKDEQVWNILWSVKNQLSSFLNSK